MQSYVAGTTVTIPLVLEDESTGSPYDPTILKFIYTSPAGVSTTRTYGVDADLIKDASGTYHVDITLTTGGVWGWAWVVDDVAKVVVDGELFIRSRLA